MTELRIPGTKAIWVTGPLTLGRLRRAMIRWQRAHPRQKVIRAPVWVSPADIPAVLDLPNVILAWQSARLQRDEAGCLACVERFYLYVKGPR